MVTKRELLADVWQQAYGGSERSVDVHLSWLRRKLGETAAEPRYLHVVRGVGVRLVDPDRRRLTSTADAGLMQRRISWLVLATTSTIVVAFVIPLCLLVQHAGRGPRDGGRATRSARNVAILVSGGVDDETAARGGRPRRTSAATPPRAC